MSKTGRSGLDANGNYDWNATLSYDAPVTAVVSSRGPGKTFGLRMQCVRDYLEHGWRFVDVSRTLTDLKSVRSNYFDRIQDAGYFEGYEFKSEGPNLYIASKKAPNGKQAWGLIGYLRALTQAQSVKKETITRVRRIVQDEFIIERFDSYHRYLPGEWEALTSIVSSASRERAGHAGVEPRVYLLGNACDLVNPVFSHYGIDSEPPFGYTWYDNKTFLLHRMPPGDYERGQLDGTVAGRMARGTSQAAIIGGKGFADAERSREFVRGKTGAARYQYAFAWRGSTYGVWCDWDDGYYYVTADVPANSTRPVYALSTRDNRANYIVADRARGPMRTLAECYRMGLVRFSSAAIAQRFLDMLALFGIR